MVAGLAIALVVGVVIVREGMRRWVHGPPFRFGEVVALRAAGSPRRRALVIASGLGATYVAVVAIAFAYAAGYGRPSGERYYLVQEVIAEGAADGRLRPGDRIEALDGAPLRVGVGDSLVDRVQRKAGAGVELQVRRDGAVQQIRIEPRSHLVNGEQRWLLGIRPSIALGRTREDAVAHALAYPVAHTRDVLARLFEDEEVDIGGPVRLVDEFAGDPRPSMLEGALERALPMAGHLLLLAALLDLVRLAVLAFDLRRRRVAE